MATEAGRFQVLDGWRGLSILFVLATHLLPLGPKAWQLNATSGALGMSLFFALSGFLITNFLLRHEGLADFIIRRTFRIVPLAWLGATVGLWMAGTPADYALPNYLFYANLPPIRLGEAISHFWSLCVEMQFYVGVALLVAYLRKDGLMLLPWACLLVTALRVYAGEPISIVTYFRVDEILSGASLALAYAGRFGAGPRRVLRSASPYLLLALLLLSSHPDGGYAQYLRPYFAAMLVGATLMDGESRLARILKCRALAYIAAISYALYVIHPLVAHSWLGSGDVWEKYAKRPLLFAVTFALAHASTFYFENRFIALGRRLSARLSARQAASFR